MHTSDRAPGAPLPVADRAERATGAAGFPLGTCNDRSTDGRLARARALGVSFGTLAALALLSCGPTSDAQEAAAPVARADFQVPGDDGVRLFVREVRTLDAANSGAARPPVLLLHGARVPGVASFDLPVAGGSLAADLAAAGHRVYVMDARGYGGSTRPPEMSGPPDAAPPLVRSDAVVRDVAAVVAWVRARTSARRVALLGWATGGHWLGMYASLAPDAVSHLVLLNTLYGGTPTHPSLGAGSPLESPTRPGTFDVAEYGAYRVNTGPSLLTAWDRSIPLDDKAAWRDPAVAAAYVRAALASDPTSATRTPPSFRSPSGAMEDSYHLATGRRLWDASRVRAATLVVRSGRDFWSRPGDVERLRAELVNAQRVQVLALPQATHFLHLDRPERGRAALLDAVLAFLRTPPDASAR